MKTVVCLLLVVLTAAPLRAQQSLIFNQYITQPDVWRPAAPSEPGVDAKGDLTLSVPVMTVPGRGGLDYTIQFTYRSGIRVGQRAGWIGLGWEFDPGSITREPMALVDVGGSVHGTDWATGAAPVWQPDAYFVTTPAGSSMMTRFVAGATPPRTDTDGFYLNEWRPWKVDFTTANPVTVVDAAGGGTTTSVVYNGAATPKPDYTAFTITADDGSRYIFAHPTLSTFRAFASNLTEQDDLQVEYFVSTWRLRAILGPDYLGPDIPVGVEAGSWIRFDYTAPTTIVDMNGVEAPTRQQVAYLSAIVTPTHQASFSTSPRFNEDFALYEEGHFQELNTITLAARSAPTTIIQKVEPITSKLHQSPEEKRLSLDGIKIYGKSSDASMPAYAFTYWGSCHTTITGDHDDWFGFCHQDTSDVFNTGSNNAGRAWSLKRITYPTGGYDEFDYEDDAILSTETAPFWQYDLENGATTTALTFSVTTEQTRQGGARVLSYKRGDGLGSEWTATYSYGAGRLSGIPSGWWKTWYTTFRAFLGSERGQAAVFYDYVRRTDPDGGAVQTHHVTSGNHAASALKLQTFLYLKLDYGNANFLYHDFTLVQGNQHWNWGLPFETRYFNNGGTNPVRKTTRTYDFTSYKLASAFTSGANEAKIVWAYADKVSSETDTDYGQSASPSTFITRTTTYEHDSAAGTGTGYVTSTEETLNSTATPARRTEYTYTYQQYTDLNTRNILHPAVQTLVGEKTSATSTTWHASQVTRWGSFSVTGGTLWKPKYTVAWNGAASATKPTYSNWSIDTIPAGWQKKDETTAYNEHGLPTSTKDPRGKVITLTYFTGTTGTSVIPPGLLKTVARSGLSVEFGYDASFGLITTVKDENEHTRTYEYDNFGRLQGVKDRMSPSNTVTTFTYTTTTAPFQVLTKQFHAGGLAYETLSFYDGLGRPLQSQTKDGSVYIVGHTEYLPGTSSAGAKVRQWKPYSHATAGAYHAGFAATARTQYGSGTNPYVETQYRRDGLARVSHITPENDGVTAPNVVTSYNVGALDGGSSSNYSFQEITDEVGHITRTYTDTFGRTKQSVAGYNTADKAVTTFTYNVLGLPTQIVDPRGLVTTNTYNVQGQLTQRISPDAGTVKFEYDAAGNIRFSQDAVQTAGSDVLYTKYDDLGRPTITGLHTNIGFATLAGTTDYSWETSTTGYFLFVNHYGDAANGYAGTAAKPGTSTFPWSLFSTQINAVPAVLNGKAHRTAVAFKSNGRWQIELASFDNEERAAWKRVYTEAAAGGIANALNTTFTYAFNWQDQPTSIQSTVGSLNWYQWYDYNERGTEARSSASTTSIKPALADVQLLYNPAGAVRTVQLAEYGTNSYRDSKAYTYNLRGWVTGIDLDAESTPFAATYEYAGDGNVTTAIVNQGAAAIDKRYRYVFTYDALNRMKTADYSYAVWNNTGQVGPQPFAVGGWDWYFSTRYDVSGVTYDKSGNLTALTRNRETGSAIDQLTYAYTPGTNRLASVTDALTTAESWDAETGSFSYDASGNMKTAPAPYGITATVYDERNLPISITAGTTTTYRYSADGQRFAKKVGSAAGEHYVLDGSQVIGVFSDTGALKHWNIISGGSVWGRYDGAARFYYHKDALGSTRLVMNGAGTTVEWRDYYPFGLTMPGRSYLSGAVAKEGFTGKERDAETGLDYFGARYYMPALGRWGSMDLLALDPAQVDKSPYAYSWNNPATLTDPDGRCPKCLKTAYNVVKRAYKAAENAGDMSQLFKLDTWKKAGVDEVVDFVDNVSTLADGQATVDDATAVVDLVTGLGDEAKAVGKAVGAIEEAGDIAGAARKTDFVVTETGTAIPVPDGAVGPSTPPSGGKGMVYSGGSGGKGMHASASDVFIMDPITGGPFPQGRRVYYMNDRNQKINRATGQTVGKKDPEAHIYIEED
ncbi:MAG: RHS repeat-associated core domain-containing protein [Rhodothermales bacterium]|nr:RHS repeat-associated core domain-containing protein [Rhodothermales bacterium]